jgi:DNA-binding XRE family transcriptional regulator
MGSMTVDIPMTVPPKTKTPSPSAQTAPVATALQKTFGRNLKIARNEVGLSQRGLSALAGISQRHISAVEMGTVNVSIETIAELSLHVGKTPVEMLTPTPPPKKPR